MAMNRIFVQYSGTTPTSAQLATFCEAVSTAVGSDLESLANANVVQEPIQCEDLTSSTSPVASGSTTHTGTRTGAPLAAGSAALVHFLIPRRYRGGKPKIFLPFGTSTDLTNQSTWGSSFQSALLSGFEAFIASITGALWTGAGSLAHVNNSYYSGFTPVQNPITHRWRNVPNLRGAPIQDGVVSYSVEPQVGSQRRRNGA